MKANIPEYSVYEHWRPDTNVCFYVGKGRRSRHLDFKNRNKWYLHIANKLTAAGLKIEVKILARGLINDVAVTMERERIAFYGRQNLVNLTDGGEGRVGYVVSQETREKIRRANTGKKCSEATKKKLSLFNTGRKRNPEKPPREPKPCRRFVKGHVPSNKGKSPSLETRQKISASLLGRPCPFKGKPNKVGQTTEAKQKIAAALRGRKRPPEVCARISAGLLKYNQPVTA